MTEQEQKPPAKGNKAWTKEEVEMLCEAFLEYGEDYEAIADLHERSVPAIKRKLYWLGEL